MLLLLLLDCASPRSWLASQCRCAAEPSAGLRANPVQAGHRVGTFEMSDPSDAPCSVAPQDPEAPADPHCREDVELPGEPPAGHIEIPAWMMPLLVERLEPSWLGTLRHVSAEARRAVCFCERKAGAPAAIRVRELCASPDLLAWAAGQGMPWDGRLYSTIASTGDLGILQWAAAQEGQEARALRLWLERCLVDAAAGGHLAMVQWITSRTSGCDEWVMAAASKNGHLAVIQWLRSRGVPWNEWVCQDAAWGGHLEVIQWAREHGCVWDAAVVEAAAGQGHLEILRWCLDNGCPSSSRVCEFAAKSGELRVLQWARENAHAWDERTCEAAAGGGHLALLQWATEQGCPMDKWAFPAAAAQGHLPVLEWGRRHLSSAWDQRQIVFSALSTNQVRVIQWLGEL
eukprot:jgi/Tetstr1/438865/TSEL_027374.t1